MSPEQRGMPAENLQEMIDNHFVGKTVVLSFTDGRIYSVANYVPSSRGTMWSGEITVIREAMSIEDRRVDVDLGSLATDNYAKWAPID